MPINTTTVAYNGRYTEFQMYFLASVVTKKLIRVGTFEKHGYGIQGEVFLKDEKTVIIKGFSYNAGAPAAVFLAGTSEGPSPDGTRSFDGTILPHPFKGVFYTNDSPDAPILDRPYDGEEIL